MAVRPLPPCSVAEAVALTEVPSVWDPASSPLLGTATVEDEEDEEKEAGQMEVPTARV